jgi:polar amino acid transport system substrate-binding protein
VRQQGVIRVGYASEAPYAFRDAGGRVTGQAPETARRVLADMGIPQVEWVQVEFGALIAELNAGRFDMIASGMFITPERGRLIAFSEPTLTVRQGLLVAQGNPKGLHSYEDVARTSDARLSVLDGAVEHGYARRLGIPAAQLLVAPDVTTALAAVKTGRADALALTLPTIRWIAGQHEGLVEVAAPFTEPTLDGKPVRGYGGYGFRRSDATLVAAFNRSLAAFIGSTDYLTINAPFGFTADELPGAVKTADLIKDP